MIEKVEEFFDDDRQTFEVHCDFCSYYQSYEDIFNWDDLMKEMRKDGWKNIRMANKEWQHKCLSCSQKGEKDEL